MTIESLNDIEHMYIMNFDFMATVCKWTYVILLLALLFNPLIRSLVVHSVSKLQFYWCIRTSKYQVWNYSIVLLRLFPSWIRFFFDEPESSPKSQAYHLLRLFVLENSCLLALFKLCSTNFSAKFSFTWLSRWQLNNCQANE